MNKLMTVCVAAFAALQAFAGAQVYEMTMTLKTTVTARGAITAIVCDTPSTEDVAIYRKQSTVKIKGLFWGCDCETIAEPTPVASSTDTYGFIFWNETTKKVLPAEFGWKILNRIDKKLKKAEGLWTLEGDEINLTGAGFGTVKDNVSKSDCVITSTIVTPMSGNVVGWIEMPPVVVSKGKDDDCYKCSIVEGSDEVVAVAPGWTLCACEEGSELTAVSGTWKLKYLASAARKWGKVDATEKITSIYSFPAYVANYINSLD